MISFLSVLSVGRDLPVMFFFLLFQQQKDQHKKSKKKLFGKLAKVARGSKRKGSCDGLVTNKTTIFHQENINSLYFLILLSVLKNFLWSSSISNYFFFAYDIKLGLNYIPNKPFVSLWRTDF